MLQMLTIVLLDGSDGQGVVDEAVRRVAGRDKERTTAPHNDIDDGLGVLAVQHHTRCLQLLQVAVVGHEGRVGTVHMFEA